MRFKQFLNEKKDISSFDEVISMILRDCKPFLRDCKQHGGQLVYRGLLMKDARGVPSAEINEPNVNVAHFNLHPVDRKPKDSSHSPSFNLVFNGGIQKAFGIENIRMKTVFGTGYAAEASNYGHLSFMFPKGNYKLLCSKKIQDSYSQYFMMLRDIRLELIRNDPDYNFSTQKLKSSLEEVMLILPNLTADEWVSNPEKYDNVFLEAFGNKGLELKDIKGSSELSQDILDSIGQLFKELYSIDTLYPAIASRSEILFYETDGYYTVPYKFIKNEMERRKIPYDSYETDGEGTEDRGPYTTHNELVDAFLMEALDLLS
jgi:hypothetical protein